MSSIVFFLVFIPLLSLILLSVNLILAPHMPYKEKETPFECGYHSFLWQNRTQFTILFFIFGLLFLLFDLEILSLIPFATTSKINGVYGFIVFILFSVIVTIGFIFEIGKKALTIESRQNEFTSKSSGTPLYWAVLAAMLKLPWALLTKPLGSWLLYIIGCSLIAVLFKSFVELGKGRKVEKTELFCVFFFALVIASLTPIIFLCASELGINIPKFITVMVHVISGIITIKGSIAIPAGGGLQDFSLEKFKKGFTLYSGGNPRGMGPLMNPKPPTPTPTPVAMPRPPTPQGPPVTSRSRIITPYWPTFDRLPSVPALYNPVSRVQDIRSNFQFMTSPPPSISSWQNHYIGFSLSELTKLEKKIVCSNIFVMLYAKNADYTNQVIPIYVMGPSYKRLADEIWNQNGSTVQDGNSTSFYAKDTRIFREILLREANN